MLNKVCDFIAKHQLLSHDGLHVVALSGGADSVALLRILCDLGYHIEAAHCNFHLRGEESNRDEKFVKDLCQKLNIPLHLIHFDTAEYASLHQESIEMAARKLRYGYFRQLCDDIGAETVCVAHHRDDAVETLLENPYIATIKDGMDMFCEYLDSIGQDYVIDSTNLQTDVLRNKIRLQLLPLMEELSPAAADNMARSAYYLSEAEKVYNSAWYGNLGDQSMIPSALPISVIKDFPSSLCFLYEWLKPFGFNRSQIEQIVAHLDGESGRVFESSTHTLAIDRDRLVVEPVSIPIKPLVIPEPGCYRITEKWRLYVQSVDDISISKLANCATLDKEKILFPLTIRPIQSGDSFCPFGMEGHKLVSDFLTDCKRSVLEKRRQLVVTDAKGDLLWLVGLRTDHRYRVTSQTTTVLRLTLQDS